MSDRKVPKAATTATATKTSLKNLIRAASNFIALIPSRLLRQMSANIFEVQFERTLSKFRIRKESCCLVFPSSTKREFRHFHVVVVQRRLRGVQKKRDARAKLLFCQSKPIGLLLFSLPSLLKLPNITEAVDESL